MKVKKWKEQDHGKETARRKKGYVGKQLGEDEKGCYRK